MLSIEEAKIVLAEIIKRSQKARIDILSSSFDKQRNFILDPARLKSAFCTRRAAKSYTAGLYLIKEARENPGVSCLYIALTRDSAKRILWKDVLKVIDRDFKLGIKFNESALTATLPNGSVIYLVGADSDETEKQKLLGQKYKIVVIDEAASFTIDLVELVYGILKPAVADLRGTICLVGTPGNLPKGLFFDITNNRWPGWSNHVWSTFDNPFMAKQWQEEIDELIAANPLIVETSLFKQMYLGQWVIDSNKLVYKYNASRNNFQALPPQNDYIYVLGIDLGYWDDTAFVVSAFHRQDPNLYFIETFKKAEMDITAVGEKAKELDKKYKFDVKVCDGAHKQAIMELNNRHGLNLLAADKTGKVDFIEIFNAELIQGRIKAHDVNAKALIEEWQGLIWDERSSKKEENKSSPNHLCDAALYNWRYTYTYLAKPITIKPKIYTPAWYQDEIQAMEERSFERYEKKRNEEQGGDPWKEAEADGWAA